MCEQGIPPVAEQRRGLWGWARHQFRTNILNPSFWLGLTLSFPLEHFLWEHVWPFKLISKWLGL